MLALLVVCFNGDLHQSVSDIPLHKVCDFSPAIQHIFRIDRFVPFDFCGFARQKLLAEKVLAEEGYLIKITEVVGVKIGDAPGKLTEALRVLNKNDINMEYLYAFMARTEKHAYVVLRVQDNAKAEAALEQAGYHIITEADVNKL